MLFFNRSKIAELQQQNERLEGEAKAREEQRAETMLALAQEAAAKTHDARKDQERHNVIERKVWLKQIAAAHHQIRAARKLNCITAVAAFIALGALGGLIVTVIDARNATIEANRAWVGIYRADHGVLIATKPMYIQLTLVNTGREPALRGNWGLKIHSIKYIPQASGNFVADLALIRNTACDGVSLFPPGEGTSIWPTLFHTPDPSDPNDSRLGPAEIPYVSDRGSQDDIDIALTKGKSLILDACFVYWTGNQKR